MDYGSIINDYYAMQSEFVLIGFLQVFAMEKSIDDIHFHQSIFALIFRSISTHKCRSISSTEPSRFAKFVFSFVDVGCSRTKGGRRGDSIETPTAQFLLRQFAIVTLGQGRTRKLPSLSSHVLMTLKVRSKARNA